MKPTFIAPAGALDRKPRHGEPCNRCGLCCMATLCALGQHVFQRHEWPGPCPGLRKDGDGSYSCNVANEPLQYARDPLADGYALRHAALTIIGAGDGCDARFNGEWRNEPFSDALDAKYQFGKGRLALRHAKHLWGMK